MKRTLLCPLLLGLLSSGFAHAEPVPIFDGKTLEGWEGNPKIWRVEEGEIRGGSLTEQVTQNEFLATKKSYANFDLRLKIRLTGTGFVNSGVQIRSVRVPGSSEMSGYQVDYGDGWYGKLYDESRRNKVIGEAKDLAAVKAAIKPGEWNEYRIRTEGPRIQSWVNGVPALDYTEADPNIAQDGHIGIQVHGGGKALVQVKDVAIEELPATPNAPTWEKVGRPGEKKKGAAAKLKQNEKVAAQTALTAGARTPEEERAAFKLPEGFEAELVAAEIPEMGIGKFVPIAFDQKGALWTTTALEYPVDGNENPKAADALYASKAKDKVLVYDRDPAQPTGYSPKPRIFAEGLAIPLGVLPYKNGCYVQHGHDIAFLEDTDADGKADKRTVILTGFGVQDSHLFPHQFLRAPGGWIWMAQGAFNYSKVRRPDQPAEEAVKFDQTRMAKFRPDGSGFDITSNGPCNIWGLVLNGEGEAFIQEANDFGYPVMPFHEYANYPGCSDGQWKSYAPEFPGTAPDFRMGGTGLSGLALTDKAGPFPEPWRDMMLVANPITNRIQGIRMHRDGPYWKLDKPQDFLVSEDPWFRPVAITVGPDGCLYIVDWYNKIISHNEVPRNHPDRDKTRGRIWRVKATAQKPFDVPDFTKLSGDELIAKLGGDSLAQSHLAWQALADRTGSLEHAPTAEKLFAITIDPKEPTRRRVQALWALRTEDNFGTEPDFAKFLNSPDRNLRREGLRVFEPFVEYWLSEPPSYHGVGARRMFSEWSEDPKRPLPVSWFKQQLLSFADDKDPEVRATTVALLGRLLSHSSVADELESKGLISVILRYAREPLAEPLAPSTRNGKPIKVREAYDREFERYLVRMFLERHPDAVAKFLDSDGAKPLPVEARLLASLALEPRASAARVAKLLPQLQRPPGQEEILRLVQFLDEPGVGEAVKATLGNPATSPAVLNALLELRSKLEPAKLAPLLTDAAAKLIASKDAAQVETGVKLAGAFKLASAEPALIQLANATASTPTSRLSAVRALAEIGSSHSELFASLAESAPDLALREAALTALASSKAANAPAQTLALYTKLSPAQRRIALDQLSGTRSGAAAVVAAATAGKLPITDLDAAALDRLLAVLGDKDAALNGLVESLGTLFRPVLTLDGSEQAFSKTGLSLDGPLTVETWIKLAPGISNADGILGADGQVDLNFFDSKFRVWAGPGVQDAVMMKKGIVPEMWTHVAATRDAAGKWKLYLDGTLEAAESKPAGHKLEGLKIAATGAPGGTKGALAEFRIWNRERSASEIIANFDRSLPDDAAGLVFNSAGKTGWGELAAGAKVSRTSDLPPVLTADQAAQLDAKFAKYSALAAQPGDINRGKQAAVVCSACHLLGTTGGQIGPNLSGVGAMGTEAILRNILTPNAAMESAYRIYRVEQRDGSVLDAFFVSEDKDAVVIRLPGGSDQRVSKMDIVRTTFLRRSLMPEGLLDGLPDQQVSDLFAYLRTLK